MKKVVLLYFMLFSLSVYSSNKSKFIFERETDTFSFAGGVTGRCFEVDIKTSGQEYKVSVASEKCKPVRLKYKRFSHLGFDPRCYGVGDNGWIEKVQEVKCKTKNVTVIFERERDSHMYAGTGKTGYCYEVDLETKGKEYKNIVDILKCKPTNTEFKMFKFLGLDHRCFEVAGEWLIEAETKKCKPEKTKFIFQREKSRHMYAGGLIGYCYEVDAETSGDIFRDMVDINSCRPINTRFKILDHLGFGNECFEIGPNDKSNITKTAQEEEDKSLFSFAIDILDYFTGEEEKNKTLKVTSTSGLKADPWIAKSNIENCRSALINEENKEINQRSNSDDRSNSAISH